ncbi:hypothetical protein DL98DRAFT_124010 [Cadophora sp. DSE1049]|nr:hypothetical protein DL98DRAFT_124010 [Cadophora sp. DSE1049]
MPVRRLPCRLAICSVFPSRLNLSCCGKWLVRCRIWPPPPPNLRLSRRLIRPTGEDWLQVSILRPSYSLFYSITCHRRETGTRLCPSAYSHGSADDSCSHARVPLWVTWI